MNKKDKDDLKMVSVMLLLSVIFMIFALMFHMQEEDIMEECSLICKRLNLSFEYIDGTKCACSEGIGKIHYVNRSTGT